MTKIAEQIQKLKEQEKRLHQETRKVEFLTHILESAKQYEHADFSEVKPHVVSMLEQFVQKQIEAIEAGTEITITVGNTTPAPQVVATTVETPVVQAPVQKSKPAEIDASPNEKMNFAMTHRHLAGKRVQVENDKNLEIKGEVVGLDAPFVIVKVSGGPTIKVPRDKVVLS